MTTATPPAPYSTLEGALASGFAITQLHHSAGRDPFLIWHVPAARICLRPTRLLGAQICAPKRISMKRDLRPVASTQTMIPCDRPGGVIDTEDSARLELLS